MLNSIKKYLKKAKEEVSKEYSITSEETTPVDAAKKAFPTTWTGVDLDGKVVLDGEPDAADVFMGNDWRTRSRHAGIG